MKHRHTHIGLALVGLICLVPIRDAFAYLDPGTGSYILQMVIAAALGGLLTIKIFWARIKRFFGRLFGRGSSVDQARD